MIGISSQMRRAALSIPANIAEGYAGKSKKELLQYINIAIGSPSEIEYLYSFSKRLNYHNEVTSGTEPLIVEVGKLLRSFRNSI